MPDDEIKPGSGIVKSIFDRVVEKKVSSLFTHKPPGVSQDTPAEKSVKYQTRFKKHMPFGLDIGADSIKIVQLGNDESGILKVEKLIVKDLREQTFEDTGQKERALPEILKDIVKENGLKGDCFVTAPKMSTRINLITLPKMPLNEIDNALQWKIRQLLQQDMNDITWDYIVLEKQKLTYQDSNEIDILAISALKKELFQHLALLESAGLKPLAMDIEPLADISAYDYINKVDSNEVVLFLNLGASKTVLSIVCNKELISTRVINVGGDQITNAVKEYCKVPASGAEALKKTFGITASAQEDATGDKALQVKNAILPLIENMAQDIEHSFKHFSYQVTKSQIRKFDRLILSGGTAYLKGLVPFLCNRLSVDVDLTCSLNPFSPIERSLTSAEALNLGNYDVKTLEELGSLLNIAVGLALRGIAQ